MAHPPHVFTPLAQGLLAAFFVLYLGFAILGVAWLLFVETCMYRMWLASFESDWVEKENAGWWDRYVRLERWLGRVEHAVYLRTKNIIKALYRAFAPRSKSGFDDHAEAGSACE
jgi:hypothetical protein